MSCDLYRALLLCLEETDLTKKIEKNMLCLTIQHDLQYAAWTTEQDKTKELNSKAHSTNGSLEIPNMCKTDFALKHTLCKYANDSC